MKRKNTFAADTVRQLQQWLDEVPAYQATELSKQQTIHALAPQVLALHAKGYGWAAIAAMLSERGVPVSAAALRTYLRRTREGGALPQGRTAGKRRAAAPSARTPAAPAMSHAPEPAPNVASAPSAAPARAVTAASATPSTPSRSDGGARGRFTPRPDSEDL